MKRHISETTRDQQERRLKLWLEKYSQTHTNPINKLLHYLFVPPIFFTVLALTNAIKFGTVGKQLEPTAAHILVVFAVIFYSRLSVPYAALMGIVSTASVYLSEQAENHCGSSYLIICGAVFGVAWIGQFVGHKIEGAKPAFFDDLTFLLIGPLWIIDRKLKWSASE